jgi:hypothetical protein
LFRRDAVGLLRVLANKVLATAGDNVGLVAIGAQILQDFLHGLVRQLGVEPVVARVLGGGEPLLHFGSELFHRHPCESSREDFLEIFH